MARIVALFLSLFLFLGHGTVSAEEKWSDQLQQDVKQWMERISEKDSRFSSWKQAESEIRALGANQHQWLIIIRSGGKQEGYMVVGEEESPVRSEEKPLFVLLEYGLGDYILFDERYAPSKHAAVPIYDGFASSWRITGGQDDQYVDAKTGEPYPTTFRPDPVAISTLKPEELITPDKQLIKTHLLTTEEKNPFDRIGWMASLPDSESDHHATNPWQRLSSGTIGGGAILRVTLFHKEVTAPYAISAVHLWNGEAAYIGVWDEGLRFLPAAYTSQVGTLVESMNSAQ